LYPLAEILQMRGGVQPGLVARRLERGGAKGRGRAFALRPGHMDDGIAGLRIAQRGHQRAHPVEIEIGLGELRGMFQAIIYKTVEIVEGMVEGGFGVH
jgi:hypothetical protein